MNRREEPVEVDEVELPAAEQDILDLLHKKTEAPHNKQAPDETMGKLHHDIERCGCYPIFKQYASGEIPTLDRMFQTIKPLVVEMDQEIQNERARVAKGENDFVLNHLEKCRGLLLGRESQIRGGIQRYVNSVIRFNRLRKSSAGGARDLTKQFEEADHARRRAHNDLIASLKTYVDVIENLWEESTGDELFKNFKFVSWKIGEDARESDPVGDRNIVIDKSALKNREFIRDWAIVADFHEQLKELGDEEWLNKTGTTDKQ